MKYDLATLIRRTSNTRRRQIVLRPIALTAVMAGNLYAAAYKPIITAWQRAIDRIAEAYAANLPVRDAIRDGIFDLESIFGSISDELTRLVLSITPALQEWTLSAERWHRGRWRGAVLTATNVDVGTLLGPQDVSETLGAFVARNVGLVRSVSDDTRAKIADIVFRNFTARVPSRQVAKEIAEVVGLSRKRALRIASDQNSKLAARLDQARQEEAGISRFLWRSSHKLHARPWHAARDGKIYYWATLKQVDGPDEIKPGDNAGEPPYCGCRTQPVIDL